MAALTSRATAGLASNVCGSVFGLLRIDDTFTYLPPIWPITSAYSFSAPIAVILVVDAAAADEPPPAALDEAGEDQQALASRAAAQRQGDGEDAGAGSHDLVLPVGEAPLGGAELKTNTVMVIIFIKPAQATRRGSPARGGAAGGVPRGAARRYRRISSPGRPDAAAAGNNGLRLPPRPAR